MNRRSVLGMALLLSLGWPAAAKKREWKNGTLVSVEVTETANETGILVWHHYICTVTDGELNYVAQYEKPLKAIVKDSVKFVVDAGKLIISDTDGKERSAHLWKRERVEKR
jgi:hypothetical protein